MKILQVITSLQTGGAEHIVVELSLRLKQLGHQVDVVTFNGVQTPFMDELEKGGSKVYKLGTGYYNPSYILKLRKIMKNYDVIHTHNSSPQLFAAMANIGLGKKLVTTEHSTNNRKREHPVFSFVDKWMYKHYHAVVTISKIAEDKLREYLGNIKNTNILTINNGVDVEAIHQASADKELIALKEDRKAILMVAGFREAKDQDTIVRALSLLDQSKYEVWFAGIGVRMDEVKSLVNELNLNDRVRFLGLRMDIPHVLKSADMIIMSSHWEGLSLSNVEGMSAAKPFIASNVKGLKEVTSGYGLLFEHENAQQLADIIQHLATDSAFYQATAEKCYERALMFDISDMVQQYLATYNAISKS